MPWEDGGLKVIKYTFTLKQTFDKAASGRECRGKNQVTWFDASFMIIFHIRMASAFCIMMSILPSWINFKGVSRS